MDVQLKRYKKEFEHSYAYGVFPTLELLKFQPKNAIRVLVSTKDSKNEGVLKIEAICRKEGTAFEVNDKLVERLAPAENVYAIGVFRKYPGKLVKTGNHIVLANPSDMGNLGTIVRTMAGFGETNLAIIRPAVDIFDPKVIRSSMGAIFQLHFEYFERFEDYQRQFMQNVYPFMTNGKVALPDAKFKRPFALVFGNEGAGLPDKFLEIGTSVTIPHNNNIDSLNLPVAVSIALYEATRSARRTV